MKGALKNPHLRITAIYCQYQCVLCLWGICLMFDGHRHHERKLHVCDTWYMLWIICVRFSAYLRYHAVDSPYTGNSTGGNILLIAVNAHVWSSNLVAFVLIATRGMQIIHQSQCIPTPWFIPCASPIERYSSQALMRTHDSSHCLYRSIVVWYCTTACNTADRTVKYRRTTTESGVHSARMFVPWHRPSYPPFSRRPVPPSHSRFHGSLYRRRPPSDLMNRRRCSYSSISGSGTRPWCAIRARYIF